jgi:putative CocE/NonD family hydrolase
MRRLIFLAPRFLRWLTPAFLSLAGSGFLETTRAEEGSKAEKQVDVTWGTKILMRDGVRLNATLYKPHRSKEALPVIFTMTPYVSDTYHDRAMYFSRNGYTFALVDVRGRGNSGGVFEPFANDGRDGYDVVEWLARQPWCNGKVAMWGGSYAGFNQWCTVKEFPPHLATIVPAASAHPGVDFPAFNHIFPCYLTQWLTYTSGVTLNNKLFGDLSFWKAKYRQHYLEHIPFAKLDEFVGNPSPHFQKWLQHRAPDDYLNAMAPTREHYARLDLPILTITGHYDDDQPGAMTYYRRHMEYGSNKGRQRHYLIVGPWDHPGTRTPKEQVGGVKFGKASLIDLNQLHKEWYDWTMKDGPKPKFLEKRVAYYVPGAEKWQYADSLEAIPSKPEKFYLVVPEAGEHDVFHSGTLGRMKPGKSLPAQYVYDPLSLRELNSPGDLENQLLDQSLALELAGNGLIYHSEAFAEAVEITGYLKLVAWIKLDVLDTDFAVAVFEIKQDGTSVALAEDRMRARYRDSSQQARLVKPGEIERYEFKSFPFFSRRLEKGSRLRLVFYSPNSRYWEKNYNSGGEVAAESQKDARTAHVALYQDQEHPSYLEIPAVHQVGSAAKEVSFDVLIRGGMIYDGSGNAPQKTDLAIRGARIAAIGDLPGATAKTVVDAKGLAVSPGFINMLSWSTDSLLADGRGQSEVRQGVTTQIMGEGWSWGPVNDAIKKRMKSDQMDLKYDIEWNTLADYLCFLQRKGISQNVASFLGATTVREYVLGLGNKKPTAQELERMRQLVEREMRDGALGIATALEYAPAYYADTEELIELCKVAAKYQGKYITHMRSEGERLLEGIDEVIRISREAKIPTEIYHFKAAGQANWNKMDAAIAKVEEARGQGLPITANMYCYTAGAAPLTACIPPWAMEGGEVAMRRRLKNPEDRQRILDDVRNKTDWPNFYRNAGSPENLVLISFKQEALKPLQGKTLVQIAKERGKDPLETLLDLLAEDQSGIGTAYFITAEENIRKLVPLPWISFGSDEAAQAPEGIFLKSLPHPRAYGNFARVLGKYVREEKVLSLESAIRKLTGLPATNLGLNDRGLLREGYYADVIVFDPKIIADRATYEKPHQYAVGVKHVFVNGVQVLKDSEHTGAKPGRALCGPGKKEK